MRKLTTSKLNACLLSLSLVFTVQQTWSQSSDVKVLSDIRESAITVTGERYTIPKQYRTLHLNKPAMQQLLAQAPAESPSNNRNSAVIFRMPMPDGTTSNFRIVESEVMAPALAAQFPDIKTYSGQGIDDPTATIKLDLTPRGFHAMVLSSKGSFFIDPYSTGTTDDYICYDKRELINNRSFICGVKDDGAPDYKTILPASLYAQKTSGTQLRTYRLALACTGEYTAFHGGTVTLGLAAEVTTMNRVNGVYEKEVAIHMTMVANNSLLVYTNASTDPYTNSNPSSLLTQNQSNCNTVIGTANYDIGHVFSTAGGGLAGLGVVCGSAKAQGETGTSSPIGDAFDIDYVAHEMGHQFGGNHTFNSQTSSCGGGNRSASNAYEPGSGITIMAYAGICGTDDLAAHSIAYFHTRSFDEIVNFSTTGGGNTCAAITNTGNTAPVVTSMGSPKSIPISTPFILTGAATDANSDPIAYSWEEFDLGPAGAWNVQSTTAPMFRPFEPVTSPSRTFPKLSDIINNTTTIGELLPNQARTLKFRLTARDNRTGGGGVMHPDTTLNISVVNNGGAFSVTAPNTAVTWAGGSTQTVTWNVNGTTASPINCANVNILLSTDGGNTFPTTVLANTANDGTENITVPGVATTTARIKVEAVGNIFFDMSNTNFTITNSGLTAISTTAITPLSYCAGSAVNVPFTTTGTANAGNIFTAQISNSSGSFASPVAIGTLTSTVGGTIAAAIPGAVTSGTGYRIRVVSSNPVVTGSDNGANISISAQVAAAGPISGPATVCAGTTVAYSVPAIGNATTYNWTLPPNATIQTGAGTSSITVAFATNSTSGNVTVAGANGTCTGTSSTLAVTVNPAPATPTAGNVQGCSGTPITLSGSPAGGTFSVPNPYISTVSTVYTYTVTNGFGCSSTSAQATILELPLPACSITGNASFCQGSATQLCAATANSYSWNTGSTTQCISATSTGTYTVTVQNSFGCTSSCSVTVSVNAPPSCAITGSSSFCQFSSTQWCAPTGLSYSWSTGVTTQCITLPASGTYTLTVTNANGCTSSCSKTLIMNTNPSCVVTGSNTLCSGSSTQFCASAGFASYLWNNGSTTQCLTVTASGFYFVTVTDVNGCSAQCSKTITVNSPPACSITGNSNICPGSATQWCTSSGSVAYQWSNGLTTQCASLTADGTYTVTVADANGCTSSCTKTLNINLAPTPVITGNTNICQGGGSTVLNAGAGYVSYNWSTGATTQSITVSLTGTYTVTVTDLFGCTGSTSVIVSSVLNPMPFITGNTSICTGSSTLLNAGSGFTTYIWSTSASVQTITASNSGNYTVTVTDANGCSGTNSVFLTTIPNPVPNITGITLFCAGSSTTLSSDIAFSSYNWSTGAITQSVNVSNANTFTLTVTDAGGCTGSTSATTTVNPLPTVSFTGLAASYTVTASPAILNGTPLGGTFSGQGISGITFTPSVAGVGGPYTITYNFTDVTGCSNSASHQTTVTNCTLPAKPSVITASGGNTKMCPGDSKVYTINNVNWATSYLWTPPAGANVSAGQGTTSATITYTPNFIATDSLKVSAINACGTGVYRALKITRGNKPAQPSVITGDINGVCNTTGVPYSVTNVTGVSYNWTNSNANFGVASGQGSSAITADFNAGYVTGTLTVAPGNGCGTGTVRNLTVKATPATPGSITGATTVCANQFGVPYAIAPIASAINYTWVAPTGGHVNDGSVTSAGATLVTTATNVTVNFGSTSGNVKVRANNTCGNGTYKTLAVTFNCREANNASSFEVNLFPNPADNEMTVSFNSLSQSSYSIKVNDIIGNTFLKNTGVAEKGENSFKLSLEDITPGVYLVEIKNGDMSRVMKLVVN